MKKLLLGFLVLVLVGCNKIPPLEIDTTHKHYDSRLHQFALIHFPDLVFSKVFFSEQMSILWLNTPECYQELKKDTDTLRGDDDPCMKSMHAINLNTKDKSLSIQTSEELPETFPFQDALGHSLVEQKEYYGKILYEFKK